MPIIVQDWSSLYLAFPLVVSFRLISVGYQTFDLYISDSEKFDVKT